MAYNRDMDDALIEQVAGELALASADVDRVMAAFTEAAKERLATEATVPVPGLGRLVWCARSATPGRRALRWQSEGGVSECLD